MVQLNLPALRSFLWGSKVNQALEDLNDAKTEAADVQAIAETVAQDKFNEVVAAPNDAVVEALVQDSGSATAAALNSTYGRPVLKVEQYGAVDTTGAADSSTAVLAAIADAQTKGAVLEFPRGTIRIDSQIILAQTAGKQKSMRWTGQGRVTNWGIDGGTGGTILDLRYGGSGHKIETYGQGVLEIDHLTLADDGTSSTPFLLTVGTTLHAHDMAVTGNPSKSRETCDQDVFILGGLEGTTSNDGPTHAFQGYGTVIERVLFEKIRTGVLARRFANSVIVRDCSFSNRCGANNDQGAIELNPGTGAAVPGGEPAAFISGTVIADNLIEVFGYRHGIRLMNKSEYNLLRGNAFWDVDRPDYLHDIFIDTNARGNVIFGSTVMTQSKHLNDLSNSTGVFGMLNLPSLGYVPAISPGNPGLHLQGSLKMPNARPILMADSTGTYREMMQLSGSNQLLLGDVQGVLSGQSVILRVSSSGSMLRLRAGTTDQVLVNSTGVGFYGKTPVARPAAIADATGGATVDAEARTALNAALAALRALGLIAS